jgi:MarR family transcriptional regulator, organic hydroperoxide resistance regulator
MNPENEVLIKVIVGSIRKLVRAVYLDSQKMSRHFGLTGPQSVAMRLLLNTGSMSSADLSRRMYVTPSNITGIIDRLEKKDLVRRVGKQGDRRVALIVLTEKGKALSERLPDPIENKFINQLADLDQEHVRILAMAMKEILNRIDVNSIDEAALEFGQELAFALQEPPPKADGNGS